jgi:hypothetical protein
VSFQNENELFSASNFGKSYVCDCYIRQFLPSLYNLQTYLMIHTYKPNEMQLVSKHLQHIFDTHISIM